MSVIGKKILSVFNTSAKDKTQRGVLKSFEESTSIGILYTWENSKKESLITAFTDEIKKNREVEGLCYNPDKTGIIETIRPIVNINELSIFGKINSDNSNNFIKKQFDYLFHLDFELNEITKALLINSKAKCRIGLHSSEVDNPYELMISISESAGLENLIEQMLKYVKALK